MGTAARKTDGRKGGEEKEEEMGCWELPRESVCACICGVLGRGIIKKER